MIKSTKFSLGLLVVRLLLGGLFLYAAYNKLKPGNPANPIDKPIKLFSFAVEAFDILPAQLVEAASFTVPWIEVVCGVLIVLGVWTRASSLVLGALTGAFVYAINRALTSGNIDVDCGCFGDLPFICDSNKLTVCHLIRSSVFAGLAAILFLFGGGRYAADGLFAAGRGKKTPKEAVEPERRPVRMVPVPKNEADADGESNVEPKGG